jgi:hypothetical protein
MHAVTVESECPYCGEPLTLLVDESAGRRQAYVEDCVVCCRGIDVRVTVLDDDVDVRLLRQDD